MNITITNSDQADLFVSVWDLNTAGHSSVFAERRINCNTEVSVDVVEDGTGKGSIHWAARRTDDATQAAEKDVVSLENSDVVEVTTL